MQFKVRIPEARCEWCSRQVALRYHDPVIEDYLILVSHDRQFDGYPVFARCEGSEQPVKEETAHS